MRRLANLLFGISVVIASVSVLISVMALAGIVSPALDKTLMIVTSIGLLVACFGATLQTICSSIER